MRRFVPRVDMSGQRFGRLVAIEAVRMKVGSGGSGAGWRCRCDCGAEITVNGRAIRNGNTSSCGCLRSEMVAAKNKANSTHRATSTPEYRTWTEMRRRCEEPHRHNYRLYGARGISVCSRWRESFENFIADMGPKPTAKHSIDRIDVNGNYEPSNCRWATPIEQARNKRPRVTA